MRRMNALCRPIAMSAFVVAIGVSAANTYAQGLPVAGGSADNLAQYLVMTQQLESQVQALEKQSQATNAGVEQPTRPNVTNRQILTPLEVMTEQKASNTK